MQVATWDECPWPPPFFSPLPGTPVIVGQALASTAVQPPGPLYQCLVRILIALCRRTSWVPVPAPATCTTRVRIDKLGMGFCQYMHHARPVSRHGEKLIKNSPYLTIRQALSLSPVKKKAGRHVSVQLVTRLSLTAKSATRLTSRIYGGCIAQGCGPELE